MMRAFMKKIFSPISSTFFSSFITPFGKSAWKCPIGAFPTTHVFMFTPPACTSILSAACISRSATLPSTRPIHMTYQMQPFPPNQPITRKSPPPLPILHHQIQRPLQQPIQALQIPLLSASVTLLIGRSTSSLFSTMAPASAPALASPAAGTSISFSSAST